MTLPEGIIPQTFGEFRTAYRSQVYDTICSYLPNTEPFAHHSMVRCYVDRQGQYRRPAYLILWTLLHGGDPSDAILPAAIQQASEDWLLIHDDLEDGNSMRRGLPAAHTQFGSGYAINAGDHLHAITWRMVFDAINILGPSRGSRYFKKFYHMMETTYQGQYLDMRLTNEVRDVTEFTEDDYFRSIHAKASYYSVYGPMQIGAIIAGANEMAVECIREYGQLAGSAFQIMDDVLDCIADPKTLGKTICNDIWEGAKTLIVWHAVQTAPAHTREALRSIYAKQRGQKTQEDINLALEAFHTLGSIEYAKQRAAQLTAQAYAVFESQPLNQRVQEWLAVAGDAIHNAGHRTQ